VPRHRWFRFDPEDVGIVEDSDYPGGKMTRTGTADVPVGRVPNHTEGCVFLDPATRGCRLHRFALERGLDVHEIKPMICLLFPVCFEHGALVPGVEFDLNDLICSGAGPTIYSTAREHLQYYFGDELITELDSLERSFAAPSAAAESIALPLVA
jgi:Fe-S-cluster containining protein